MANDILHPGQCNRRVELFKYSKTNQTTAERKRTETLIGKRWVNRIEVSGQEEEEGKLRPLSVCRFQMKFEKDILVNGTAYFIRDIDGDYQVNSVAILGGRNRWIELKCSRRGN